MALSLFDITETRFLDVGFELFPLGLWKVGLTDGNGEGVLTFANGGMYSGSFQADKRHGRGVMTWPAGGRYEGGFADNARSGQGVHERANGDRYEGRWAAGAPNGQGVALIAGERHEGSWNNGCIESRGATVAWAKPVEKCEAP